MFSKMFSFSPYFDRIVLTQFHDMIIFVTQWGNGFLLIKHSHHFSSKALFCFDVLGRANDSDELAI